MNGAQKLILKAVKTSGEMGAEAVINVSTLPP